MGREAELFVAAEEMLLEVIGRIRGDQWRVALPPLLDAGADRPAPLRTVVARHAAEEARVPDLLAGRPPTGAADGLSDADVPRLTAAACAAAREFGDRDGMVRTAAGDVTVAEYLWQLTMARSFLAHDIAMALGSRACPLPEDWPAGCWRRRRRGPGTGGAPGTSGSRCRSRPGTSRGATGSC
jgi:hypothetical protein